MNKNDVYLMGIDIGTTGVKTLLINQEGEVISSITTEYPMFTPKPNWAEQNPEDWYKSTIETIKRTLHKTKINPEKIKGIGLTGQMHGLVLLDKNHSVLRPCILWCDQRTDKQCEYITNKIGKERLIQLVCNPALTGFTAGKILWVRDNEPQIYEKIYKILLPKDYIRFRLTGEFATDVSDASGTLLLDIKNRRWSDEILNELDIKKDFLPVCYESIEITGKITRYISKLTGLIEGTPVIAGGGDQAAQAVGTGIVKIGDVSATIGTSGVVFAFTDEVKLDPLGRVHTFCHAVPGKWHIMGVMLSAGGSLRWFRDNFCNQEKDEAKRTKKDVYDIILRNCSNISAGSDGLIFLPYLTGERTPHSDPYARGVFFGLSLLHTKDHIARSILEGVTYGMKDSLEIIKEMNVPVNQIRLSGGGAKSLLWRQIQSDIYNRTVVTVNITEGAAYGAALLATVRTGIYGSVEQACKNTIKVTSSLNPDIKNVPVYEKYYRIYQSLYKSLKDEYRKL